MSAPDIMPAPDAGSLRPKLREKIERMTAAELAVLDRVILQLEAEGLAEQLGEAFDGDHETGRTAQIPELIRALRARSKGA